MTKSFAIASLSSAVLVSCLFGATGCASTTYLRFYEGAAKSRSESAVLYVSLDALGVDEAFAIGWIGGIKAIDAKRVTLDASDVVELPAGKTVQLLVEVDTDGEDGDVSTSFTPLAGSEYVVRPSCEGVRVLTSGMALSDALSCTVSVQTVREYEASLQAAVDRFAVVPDETGLAPEERERRLRNREINRERLVGPLDEELRALRSSPVRKRAWR